MGIFRRIFNRNDDDGNEQDKQSPSIESPVSEEVQKSANEEGVDELNQIVDTDRLTSQDNSETEPFEGDKTALLDDDEDEDTFTFVPNGVTRPLPSEPIVTSQSDGEHLMFGQATDIGMIRSNNQDSSLTFFATTNSVDDRPDFGLFIVADGMGGHHDGEKASAVAIREVASKIIKDIYIPMLSASNTNNANRPTIAESLTGAIKQANHEVIGQVPDGGTTITAMVILGNLAHVGHVGDSRAYLVTKESIEQITRDHSLVQRLIELDQLTPKEAEEHHHRNVLYRAIGQTEELEVDTLTRRIPPKSWVVICSDGLWGLIEDEELHKIVLSYNDPQEACRELIQIANDKGGHDNITVIIISMP